MIKHAFTDQQCWTCRIPLAFDPFGKGFATVFAEIDDDPSGAMDVFIDEFIGRFEQIWADHSGSLLKKGLDMPQLVEAHTATEIVISEFKEGVPGSWSLECVFDFPDGPEISYGLDFHGWITDGHFTGCH